MSAPTHERLRFGDVVDWLCGEGLSQTDVRRLIAEKIIRGTPIRPGGRNYYFKSQITRDVLAHDQVESRK